MEVSMNAYVPYRPCRGGFMIGSLFEQIFSPSSRHAAGERRRLALAKDDIPASGTGGGPIDLDSGKVLITAGRGKPVRHPGTPESTE
ncbi:DUF6191 domain-containing protein [Streptomyces sp. NPDC001774]